MIKQSDRDLLGPRNPTRGKKNNFESWCQLFNKIKIHQVYLGEKEGDAIAGNRITVIHDAETPELVPILEFTSDEETTMDQELANCNKKYDIATYYRIQVCATIKKYKFNEPPFTHISVYFFVPVLF